MPLNSTQLPPLKARLSRYINRYSRGRRCGCRFSLRIAATFLVILWLMFLVFYFQVLQFDREPEDRSMTAHLHFGPLGREELIAQAQALEQDDNPIDKDENKTEDEPTPQSFPFHTLQKVFGTGEMGRAVIMKPENLTERLRLLYDDGWKRNQFNQLASDVISLRRTLPDVRDEWCKSQTTSHILPISDLPMTSVIIIFHNEAWSTLLRSVHSVLDRSPTELIREIILVDDFSDPIKMKHLKKPLEKYMAAFPKVKIIRSSERVGLAQARLMGTKIAKGPVLTFLDSHIEATKGWLEPLLDRIARNPTTVVCPVIDVINDDTLALYHQAAAATQIGGFDWSLMFRWKPIPKRESQRRKHPAEPLRSPTLAGGLFSIDKAYFEKLGTYDDGFDIWGGENIELSFKTWMCGGTLEIIPCSHVGHIFRHKSPYTWNSRFGGNMGVLTRNNVRLALVWMDDYADHYISRIGGKRSLGNYGNITGRIELRKSLKCKSFKWYLDNVYPEQSNPLLDVKADGEIRNKAWRNKYCLDARSNAGEIVNPYQCHSMGGNQFWSYGKNGEIRRDEFCVEWNDRTLKTLNCYDTRVNQRWLYSHENGFLKHVKTGLCLTLSNPKKLTMEPCSNSKTQKWQFERVYGELNYTRT